MALKIYMTAIPAMIIVVGDAPFIFETNRMTAVGINENTNAPITIAYAVLAADTPRPIIIVAPKLAPEDIPVVYGSAKGLRRMLCITTPAAAKPIPARMPVQILGNLHSNIR